MLILLKKNKQLYIPFFQKACSKALLLITHDTEIQNTALSRAYSRTMVIVQYISVELSTIKDPRA
jgi:hypothetical protein